MEFVIPFFREEMRSEFPDIVSWRVINPKGAISTGDIILFSASGILSTAIKFISGSRWNHTGLIVWLELVMKDGSTRNDLFCFELGSQTFEDLMTRKAVDRGVRLVRLGDISEMYDIVAIRKLKWDRPADFCERFQKFMLGWTGREFTGVLELTKIFIVGGQRNAERDKTITCSGLIALMLEHFGLVKLKYQPDVYIPANYASGIFGHDLFIGEEKIIYKREKLINARLIFIVLVLVVLLAYVAYQLRHRTRKR